MRSTARSIADSKCSGGEAEATRAVSTGCGSNSGIEAGTISAARFSASSVERPVTTIHASPRCLRSNTSGRTSCAGASDDHSGVIPPSGEKAKPPTQTGPRSSHSIPCVISRQRAAAVSNRFDPRASTISTAPSAAIAKPSRSGCSKQK